MFRWFFFFLNELLGYISMLNYYYILMTSLFLQKCCFCLSIFLLCVLWSLGLCCLILGRLPILVDVNISNVGPSYLLCSKALAFVGV